MLSALLITATILILWIGGTWVMLGDKSNSRPSVTPKSVRALFLLIPLGITALGIILLTVSVEWWREYDDSKNWSSTQGIMTESRVKTSTGRRGRQAYDFVLSYRYSVDGQTYTNDRLSFKFDGLLSNNPTYNSYGDAASIASLYPLNGQVIVFYDPDNPEQAVLLREIDNRSLITGIGLGLVPIFIGLFALIFGTANVIRH